MPLHLIQPLEDPRWDRLVSRHPQASVFHTNGWLKGLRETYGYTILASTSSPPGQELTNALTFSVVESWLTGRRIVSLPFSDHCAPLVAEPQELTSLLSAVQAFRPEARCRFVELRPSNDSAHAAACEAGFEDSSRYYYHNLDLRPGAGTVYRRFHKDCVQRKIRRAEVERLTVEQGLSDCLLEDFYRLQVVTRKRQGVIPQPFAWFRNLAAFMGAAMQVRVAYKDATPVAAILTLKHRDRIVYKYGCSDSRHNALGGTQLLFWRMIQEACDEGLVELDLGRSDCDHAGLIAFKERWGARRRGASYLRSPRKGARSRKSHTKLFSMTPLWLLRAAGTALYRHAG